MRTVMLPIVLLVSLLVPGRQSGAEREDWIQLFNGKSLDGWVPKITGYPLGENYADTFRVVTARCRRHTTSIRGSIPSSATCSTIGRSSRTTDSSLSIVSSASRSLAGRIGPSATTA